MDGKSTTQQTQQSTTQPWEAAQPALTGILSGLQGQIPNATLTGGETGAINSMVQNAGSASQYTPQIGGVVSSLLGGGGATDQAGNIEKAYQTYQQQTNPLASNVNYDPYSTPGFRDAINTATSDITSGVNGQFAAAGRDFSGANSMALGRGLTQGLAPTIAAQYNSNVANQQGAAGNLYNAGNTTGGLLSGLQQQGVTNQQAGAQMAPSVLDSQNATANAQLQAEAARRGIPVQALGLLAQIGVPIAGLGGQSTGSSTGTNTMSGAQQFASIGQGAAGFGKLLFG